MTIKSSKKVKNRGQNYVDHRSHEKINSDFADGRELRFS